MTSCQARTSRGLKSGNSGRSSNSGSPLSKNGWIPRPQAVALASAWFRLPPENAWGRFALVFPVRADDTGRAMSKLSSAGRGFLERRFVRGTSPTSLNPWQEAFCEWTAERLGISPTESLERFRISWAAVKGGHGGHHFKLFCELDHDLCRVFHGNAPREIFQAYQAHAPLHFLRMLSYRLPVWPEHLPQIAPLFEKPRPMIVDFGCGLAQTAISLAEFLKVQGRTPNLFLADIAVPQLEFLRWLCDRRKLSAAFAECTPAAPIPSLPDCDLLIATEVFEHLHD